LLTLDEEEADDSSDEMPMYFSNPQQLLDIFAELEASNLFLIRTAQETEEALDENRARFTEMRHRMCVDPPSHASSFARGGVLMTYGSQGRRNRESECTDSRVGICDRDRGGSSERSRHRCHVCSLFLSVRENSADVRAAVAIWTHRARQIHCRRLTNM
jgi:hypothetical protein